MAPGAARDLRRRPDRGRGARGPRGRARAWRRRCGRSSTARPRIGTPSCGSRSRRRGPSLSAHGLARSDGVRWLEAELPGARAAFSTRLGGASDGAVRVAQPRPLHRRPAGGRAREPRPARARLDRDPEGVLFGFQVHGAEVRRRERAPDPNPYTADGRPGDGDGQVTANPALTPLVQVADCLPVALAGNGGVAMLHCGWRGLAAGIVERGARGGRAPWPPRSGPGSAPAAIEVGDEVLAEFAPLGDGVAAAGMLDLPEVGAAAARTDRGRGGRVERAVHELRARAVLLPPPRRRRHRPPGRPRVDRWLSRSATSTRRSCARTSSACASAAGQGSRSWRRPSTCSPRRWSALAEAGIELVGENRLQDLEAKRELLRRSLRLGLHRQPPEPQAEADPAAGAPDPLGRDRLGARAARPPRDPETEVLVEVNLSGEPEQGRGRARARSASSSSAARRPVGGLMTMPPFTDRPRGLAALLRPPRRARRRARARAALDGHEPGLGGGGRGGRDDHPPGDLAVSLKARRRALRCSIIRVKESRDSTRTPQPYGTSRHMAPRARLLRPRRGP